MNTTRNCPVSLSCESSSAGGSGGCNLDILYNCKEDDQSGQEIADKYCSEGELYKNCSFPFERSCFVWCVAPGQNRSKSVRVNVIGMYSIPWSMVIIGMLC